MDEVGVQAARTVLSWRRTGLSMCALAALTVKTMVHSGRVALLVAVLLVALAVVLLAVHERRLRRRSEAPLEAEAPIATSVVVLTSGCVLVALLAVVGVFVGP